MVWRFQPPTTAIDCPIGVAQILAPLSDRNNPRAADRDVLAPRVGIALPAVEVVRVLRDAVIVHGIRPGPVDIEGELANPAHSFQLQRVIAQLAVLAIFGNAGKRKEGYAEFVNGVVLAGGLSDVQTVIQPRAVGPDVGSA